MYDDKVHMVERLDLNVIAGMWVTPDPLYGEGIKLWCGYCCAPLHFDWRHWGHMPFLSLLAKTADIHRVVECPQPQGPFVFDWSPKGSAQWRAWERARELSQEQELGGAELPVTL